ncbi:MAG: hypothetical protein KDD61_12085 [Bdellovibrionales bacterium]|nr:hypothetical protein [Bdellovibrionales bacterium]
MKKMLLKLLLLFLPAAVQAADRLQPLGLSAHPITVSGISSGAAMAIQMHIVHSKEVKGVGVFAGVPYGCAGIPGSYKTCMESPDSVPLSVLTLGTQQLALLGSIDPLQNLEYSRVYVWHGLKDSVVKVGAAAKVVEMYQKLTDNKAGIFSRIDSNAEHGLPVTSPNASSCGQLGSPFLIQCGYDAIGEMFFQFYDKLPPKTSTPLGTLKRFDQTVYDPSGYFLGKEGHVYIPKTCENGGCGLHVAFHGCHQEVGSLGDFFPLNSDYIYWADSLGIVILYPSSVVSMTNPNGCWNWFGAYPDIYPNNITRTGLQMSMLWNMIQHIRQGQRQ